MTTYSHVNFFEDQLVNARNKQLQSLLQTPVQQTGRLEEVRRFGGVTFIDDSHSQDIHSLYYTLEKIQHPILWITGGDDSEVNYTDVLQLVVEKVKAMVCIGRDNTRLKQVFGPYIDTIYECENMEHAVKAAYYSADREDVVLLSSACRSDEETGRGTRSELFRNAISEL